MRLPMGVLRERSVTYGSFSIAAVHGCSLIVACLLLLVVLPLRMLQPCRRWRRPKPLSQMSESERELLALRRRYAI